MKKPFKCIYCSNKEFRIYINKTNEITLYCLYCSKTITVNGNISLYQMFLNK